MIYFRIDTGDDRRISKEEFTSDSLKTAIEKVCGGGGAEYMVRQWSRKHDVVLLNCNMQILRNVASWSANHVNVCFEFKCIL